MSEDRATDAMKMANGVARVAIGLGCATTECAASARREQTPDEAVTGARSGHVTAWSRATAACESGVGCLRSLTRHHADTRRRAMATTVSKPASTVAQRPAPGPTAGTIAERSPTGAWRR